MYAHAPTPTAPDLPRSEDSQGGEVDLLERFRAFYIRLVPSFVRNLLEPPVAATAMQIVRLERRAWQGLQEGIAEVGKRIGFIERRPSDAGRPSTNGATVAAPESLFWEEDGMRRRVTKDEAAQRLAAAVAHVRRKLSPRLRVELATYAAKERELVKSAAGRVVLIHEDTVEFYETEVAAYEAGRARYGTKPFLVQRVPNGAEPRSFLPPSLRS